MCRTFREKRSYTRGRKRYFCAICGVIISCKKATLCRPCADKARKGRKLSEEGKNKIRKHHSDPTYRENASKRMKDLWADPKYKKKVSESVKRARREKSDSYKNAGFIGKKHSTKTRKLMAISAYKTIDDRIGRLCLGGNRITTPEWKVGLVLDSLGINSVYTGGYDLWIGSDRGKKNPDFLLDNKKLIEVFGMYWHSKKVTGIPKKQHEKRLINYYAKYGYDTLIIWENELKNIEAVKEKITNFCKEDYCGLQASNAG